MAVNIEAEEDLADVLARFTNLIQNERVRAYNEGLDAGRKQADEIATAARECINDNRALGGDVEFVMGGHRRIRLANALAALKD